MQYRPIWKVVVFSLITFGIYNIYWLYKTRLDFIAKGIPVPKVIWLFAPLLGLLLVAVLQFIVHAALTHDPNLDMSSIDSDTIQSATVNPVGNWLIFSPSLSA